MRRLISKYDDFVKSKSINEDIEPMVTPESSELENREGFESTKELEDNDASNIVDNFEEEEESGEYEGTIKMKKLAKMLGTEVFNNEINYNGQKINYYSETEMFHVGKHKFKTPEEVFEFLQKKETPVEESIRFKRKHRPHKH
jgi:hypothetical protein